MNDLNQIKRQPHPKDTANIISSLTFYYTLDLFKKGYRNDLTQNDLYEVLNSCNSKNLGNLLENEWKMERIRNKTPSLYRVLWRCFGRTYIILGIVKLIMSSIMILLLPEALGKLISYFVPGQTKMTQNDACLYASIFILTIFLQFIFIQNYMLAVSELGIRIRTAVCSLIYRKCLKLTNEALNKITIGRIITMITKDVACFEMIIYFGNEIWIGLLHMILVSYLAYNKTGKAAFVSIGFFLTLLPMQIIIGRLSTKFRLQTNKKTDERLQRTQEAFSTIKIIKMYTWEKFFLNKITNARKKEVNAIHKLIWMEIISLLIGSLSTKLAFFLLILTYVWLGNFLTAELVYFIMGCFGKLRNLFSIIIPLGVIHLAELVAINVRLSTLLNSEEIVKIQNNPEMKTTTPMIIFKNATIKIDKNEIFNNFSLTIPQGLNIITGHIGCGKTTLIKTILKEYQIVGDLEILGRISYAPQEPWLYPSTIRQNILFGEEYVEKRYQKILDICDLNYDLNLFNCGDNTVISDRGVNLSRGQQARINLARAIYKDADIYLLDDCLAALNGQVADRIFNNCICEFLKDKLCVFITNNQKYLRKADKIIRINNNSIKLEDNHLKNIEDEVRATEKALIISDYKENTNSDDSKLYYEGKKSGQVEFGVYRKFLQFGGGLFAFSLVILVYLILQISGSFSEKLLSNWVTVEQNISDLFMKNQTNSTTYEETLHERSKLFQFFTASILTISTLVLIKSLVFFSFMRRASIRLHKVMITTIFSARMQFFDTYFIGNILNRFSKDLSTIDEFLPFTVDSCFELWLHLIGVIVLVSIVNPISLVPFAILFAIAYCIRYIYQRTGRSLQRLDSITRSPWIGHLNASLEGLTTIRAFNAQEIVLDEFDKHQNLFTSANYTSQCSIRALGFILDGMCSLFLALVIARLLFFPIDTTVGNVGMAISQAFGLTGLLQYGIRQWAEFENQMTSVERALEYTEIEQEQKQGRNAVCWPKDGKIRFNNVSMYYNEKAAPILKNINFEVSGKQKIGIVGRTGAGKSSIISALFRLYDVKGSIVIDKEDIQQLSLECLRSNLGIIPQEPILFAGTIRENLDPLQQYQDDELWQVIKKTQLNHIINNLSTSIDNSNLSAGQKQLICLARIMLRNNKIIVLDEATANLDDATDKIIHNVIDENFSQCTLLIIAHRLKSVLQSDLIAVINDGSVVETDQPRNLLANKNSLFYKMIKRT